MAYKVRCAVTGEYGTSDTFIKRDGRYFKNEEIYNEYKIQSEYWIKCIEKFCYDFLDYKKGQPFPTILPKRLKELSFYDNETIYRTMCDCEEIIQKSISDKIFDSDYQKISYIMAIIRNRIAKVWKIVRQEQRDAKRNYQPIPSNIYASLSEIQNPKQNVKDISRFVEE